MKVMGIRTKFIALGALGAVLALATLLYALYPKTSYLQGEIVARQINIAPKITGRIDKIHVEEGDAVKQGDNLITLNSPEIQAKAAQAKAAFEAATSQEEKVFTGTREEDIKMAQSMYKKAQAAQDLQKKTYERVKSLYDQKVLPEQKLDEAYAAWQAANNDMNAAKEKYEAAVTGARIEDKTSAQAMSMQAKGVVQEVSSYLDETSLSSPIDGEIGTIVVERGELVSPGFPVLTIVNLNDMWASFNLREDYLRDIAMGDVVELIVPAVDKKQTYRFKIKYISRQGDFSVWSATKTRGDFDLRTFEVRAVPIDKIPSLRGGMSVLYKIKK